MVQLQMHMGGRWADSLSGKSFTAYSPATGEAIAQIPEGDREDARQAIKCANSAKDRIRRMSAFDRAKLCHRIADVMEARKLDLARILSQEQGKSYRIEAIPEVEEAVLCFRTAAEDIKRLESSVIPSADPNKKILTVREPKGVYAIVTPWNWPISISSQYVSACLAAGNAMVLVPAPTTSACVLKMAECIVEAEIPKGVFNVVTGLGPVVGDEIVANPDTDAVAFTGSAATGEQVARRAAGKSLLLELGGNGPTIILDDADLERSVQATLFGCFLCAGQSCSAGERILINQKYHDQFLEKLVKEVQSIRLGEPFDEETTMGPLNNEATAVKMDRHVKDAVEKGAKLLLGGKRADHFPTRLYYEPTILDQVSPDMDVFQEESFGPVAPITVFSDYDQAIELANQSSLGLVASVFTANLSDAFYFAERLKVGLVNVNESSNYWESHTPFGGAAGTRSGYGRMGGKHTLLEMTDLKTIVLDIQRGRQ